MKVYIVKSSWGSYEDHYMKIEKVFNSIEKAEAFVVEMDNDKNYVKEFHELEEKEELIILGVLKLSQEETEEFERLYDEKQSEYFLKGEYNKCYIEEFEVE